MIEPQESRKRDGKRKKAGKGSQKGRHGNKEELKDALDNLTQENVKLQKVVNIMEDEEKDAARNEMLLLQEVEALKQSIAQVEMEKEREENNLKAKIKQLKAELYDLTLAKQLSNPSLHSVDENYERDQYETPNGYSSKKSRGGDPEMKMMLMDSASVAGVSHYDRKMHKRSKNRRGAQYEERDGRIRRSSTQRSRRGSSARRRDERGSQNRRMSTPLPNRPQEDGIDAAARAFLDQFSVMKPKLLNFIWTNVPDLKRKNNELVLETRQLPKLLHSLVVYAYQQDNPDKLPPSFRRTKPLTSLLKLRLSPYVSNKKYITFDDFQQFPFWLQQREDLGTMKPPRNFSSKNYSSPASEDVRSDLKAGSACLVWSDGGQCWCEGQVTSTKFDKEGEWLVVRYYNDSKSLEKEVQRYSDLIRVLAK